MHYRIHLHSRRHQPERRFWRRLRRGARAAIHSLASLMLTGSLALGVLLVVASARPLALGPLAERVLEARLGAQLRDAGLRARMGGLEVRLLSGLVPVITARDVDLHRVGEDRALVSLEAAELVLHRDSALRGRIAPKVMRLHGLGLSVVKRPGTVDLGLGRASLLEAVQSPGALMAALDDGLSRPALAGLETVGLSGIALRAEDPAHGWVWQSRAGALRLTRDGGRIALDLSLSGIGPEGGPGTLSMRLRGDTDAATGQARIAVRGLNPAQILPAARVAPDLAALGVLDAPVSATLAAGIRPDGELAPMEGMLRMGEGHWTSPGGQRVTLEAVTARLRLDPAADHLRIDDLSVASDALRFDGHAQVIGRRDGGGPLSALSAQLSLRDVQVAPGLGIEGGVTAAFLELPLSVDLASARLTFGPGDIVLGDTAVQFGGVVQPPLVAQPPEQVQPIALAPGTEPVTRPLPEGWTMALDLATREIAALKAVALWPEAVETPTRDWAAETLKAGTARDVRLSLRLPETGKMATGLTFRFSGAAVTLDPGLPALSGAAGFFSLQEHSLAVQLAEASMMPGGGDPIRIADGLVRKADTSDRDQPLQVTGRVEASAAAALRLLDQPFFAPQDGAPEAAMPLAPEEVAGDVALSLALTVPAGPARQTQQVAYRVDGRLDVSTTALLPGRVLAGDDLRLTVQTGAVQLEGPVTVDGEAATVVWSRAIGPGADPGSLLQVSAPLTQGLVAGFGVPLTPQEMTGAGQVEAQVALSPGSSPRLTLNADLTGAEIRISGLGWTKPAGRAGRLEMAGQLGTSPSFDRFVLDAPGFSANGRLRIAAGGGLDRLSLSRARLGGWFDGPVEIRPAADGRVALSLSGGTLDLENLPKSGGGPGAVGPVTVALDRVRVSDALALTAVRGAANLAAGVRGDLTGRLNDGGRVDIRLRPDTGGPNIRVRSQDAGRTARESGLFKGAQGGTLDLRLTPAGGGAGRYAGRLRIDDMVIRDAPMAATILSAISLVGLAEQAGTGGLSFGDINAEFLLTPDEVVISRASASGPSLGLSLDGRVKLKARVFDMQGVISPFYFVNRIGAGLTRSGEGLVGITFRLKGPFDAPQVRANPLSILTPGMFREIFRRAPPRFGTGGE